MVEIRISIAQQQLRLHRDGETVLEYPISSAANGVGEQENSGCTPRGAHHIRIKIGGECPTNSVFVGRRPTGEVYTPELGSRHPERDWILSRILWLSGDELGRNRGGHCDTLRRMIYIHGTPDSEPMGIPQSHGCIRMRNRDLIPLFEQVDNNTPVFIEES